MRRSSYAVAALLLSACIATPDLEYEKADAATDAPAEARTAHPPRAPPKPPPCKKGEHDDCQ
jgi:hypothetical protein